MERTASPFPVPRSQPFICDWQMSYYFIRSLNTRTRENFPTALYFIYIRILTELLKQFLTERIKNFILNSWLLKVTFGYNNIGIKSLSIFIFTT